MKTFGVDWGHGKKLTVCDGRLDEAGELLAVSCETSLRGFIRANAPCRIVVESTFESYHRAEKNAVIDEAERLGVDLLTISPRQTANTRRLLGLEKSDEVDARVIYALGIEGRVHLAKPRRIVEDEQTPMKRVELLRRREWPKDESEEFAQFLPDEPPAEMLRVLGDNKKLSTAFVLPLVAIAIEVLDAGGTRRDFDRRVGMYGHGYPSLTRSHCYYHRLGALRRRHLEDGSRSLRGVDDDAIRKVEMRNLRRATRWVFAQVKQRRTGKFDPATGTPNPEDAV